MFRCYVASLDTYSNVTWKFFYPQCSVAQIASGTCSGRAGAYVAAITVCNQKLF